MCFKMRVIIYCISYIMHTVFTLLHMDKENSKCTLLICYLRTSINWSASHDLSIFSRSDGHSTQIQSVMLYTGGVAQRVKRNTCYHSYRRRQWGDVRQSILTTVNMLKSFCGVFCSSNKARNPILSFYHLPNQGEKKS